MLINKFDSINCENIQCLNPVRVKDKVIIHLFYLNNKKNPLLIELPSLYLNDKYRNNKLIVTLKSSTEEVTNNVNIFMDNLEKRITSIIKNIKQQNKFIINEYKTIVNEIFGDDNNIYSNGVLQLSLLDTKVYDYDKNIVDNNNYKNIFLEGVYIKSIIELHSIIVNNGIAYVYIKTHQIKLVNSQIKKVVIPLYSFSETEQEPGQEPGQEQGQEQGQGQGQGQELDKKHDKIQNKEFDHELVNYQTEILTDLESKKFNSNSDLESNTNLKFINSETSLD